MRDRERAPKWQTGLRLAVLALRSQMRLHPGRALAQLLSIAIGIALGLAVHLIHASALDSFAAGVRQFAGTADRVVRGPREGFDLDLADKLLQVGEIGALSPVVEMEIAVEGIDKPVKWLGIDPMRAAAITPQWLGDSNTPDDLFDSRAIFVSPALLARLSAATGDVLRSLGADGPVDWRIAGTLPQAPGDNLVAVADISALQWRFGLGNRIHRIDLKAADGVGNDRLDEVTSARLPPGIWLDKPDEAGSRGAAVSRAYRVNLMILALVALLTGCFLVYASQTLAALERRRQWALMTALGADPLVVRVQVLTEAALIGAAGSALGVVLGTVAAGFILSRLGADLGSGFFAGQKPALRLLVSDCLPFLALGLACSLAGAWKPARDAAGTPGAYALKPGSTDGQVNTAGWPAAGLTGLLACPLLAMTPAIGGLPIGGYLAIASGLAGGIICMPALLRTLSPAPKLPTTWRDLSRQRTRHNPGHSGIALAGIVASFSLVVAMAVMVHSFRESLSDWLEDVLPAPVYLRIQAGDAVALNESVQRRLSNVDGLEKAEFWMSQPVSLDPGRPPPALITRPIDVKQVHLRLPLVAPADTRIPDGCIPVWVSEAMVSLYGWQQGSRQAIPLPALRDRPICVAGIWRDYARQQGAIVINLQTAKDAGLDVGLTDAAFWPKPDVSVGDITERLRSALASEPWANRVEFADAAFIREVSLRIFDRSFAITYLLEAAAIGIGLLGIATTFAATALARRHEFAALQALGARDRDILKMLLSEGLRVATVGMLTGLALGLVFSWILIHVVNPQSFNWTMDVHLPWVLLGALCAILVVLSGATAALAGQSVLRRQALQVLKEEHT